MFNLEKEPILQHLPTIGRKYALWMELDTSYI